MVTISNYAGCPGELSQTLRELSLKINCAFKVWSCICSCIISLHYHFNTWWESLWMLCGKKQASLWPQGMHSLVGKTLVIQASDCGPAMTVKGTAIVIPVVVQSLSQRLTLGTCMDCSMLDFPVLHPISRSLLELMSFEFAVPSSHLICSSA